MNKAIVGSVVAVLCHVGTASAGVPGWCKDASFDDSYSLQGLSSQEVRDVVSTLAKATCKPSAEASASAAQIEAARQAWGKKLLMNDADWADAVAYANADERPADLQLSVKDLTAMTPLDQYLVIMESGRGNSIDGLDYTTDMFEPNLSEVGRFAYVSACADYSSVSYLPAVEYAQCQGDIDAFDRAKFAAQLRSDTAHPGANKMSLRILAYQLPKKLKEHADAVQKIIAKDAAYKKLWDAAAKGRALFVSKMTDKSLLALATKLDSAFLYKSRKQFDGCEATTEAALAKVISESVPASLFKDVKRDVAAGTNDYMDPEKANDFTSFGTRAAPLMADIPELTFVIGPYAECHKPDDNVSSFLRGLLKFSPGFRGPRQAALNAIMHENVVLDDMDAKIHYPKSDQPYDKTGSVVGTSGGVVASVKEDGDHLLVSFAKQSEKGEDCIKSHYTKKVTRVNSDGSLSYELICDKYGTVTYDTTPRDQFVGKDYKALLKKGVQFSASGYTVIAVWPSKAAKVPSHILGVEVK